MKKPKRSMELEEQGPGSPGDLGFDLENQDDDDIIDLEDIVEMPVGSIDEEEDIETDVEILDADGDLDFDMLEKKAAGHGKEPSRDLWGELAFEDRGVKRVPKQDSEEPLSELGDDREENLLPKARVEEKPAPEAEEEEEDLLEGLIRAEREKQAAGVKEEPHPAESHLPTLEDDDIDEETFRLMMEEAAKEIPKEAAPSIEPPEAPAPEPAPAEAPAPVSAPAVAPAQTVAAPASPLATPDSMPAIPKLGHGSPLLDEMIRSAGDFQVSAKLNLYIDQLIGGVESKLSDAIREIVLAALPDIVRQIIREELEALKKDQD